jgi:hypothetical protein
MAVSLEVRARFLDHVVDFALALPSGLKRRGRVAKWLLRLRR